MSLSPLLAISPVDGRYRSKVECLAPFFSEYALIRYRVLVEIEYFIALSQEIGLWTAEGKMPCSEEELRSIYRNFTEEDAEKVKSIESVTNHDVKAVEYFIKEKFDLLGLEKYKEFVHFGLTSQDINNTSQPLMLKEALERVINPEIEAIIANLKTLSVEWKSVPMLARTHGQPASPTVLGKEIYVFVYRLKEQMEQLLKIPHSAKFGGATGNMNAHKVAYPEKEWRKFAAEFTQKHLGLELEAVTTQISNYDNLASIMDAYKRICVILIDLCRDIWQYISDGYFKQKVVKGEVGSSAMPHKVNPIDFENAEGNCGIAIAIFEHLSHKLPISRLQRDLTDSTVMRNMGLPVAHLLIALQSLKKGLGKLMLSPEKIAEDLDLAWAVVAEGIQTILRREGYPAPYEALKELTRGQESITEESISAFVDTLEVSDAVKAELKSITPSSYTGLNLDYTE
ncbi:MAG: adenylosuccinate lyase [Porphyromonas sp.]|nr:adenylosuccinate lyase [Porphyromonas sp.]